MNELLEPLARRRTGEVVVTTMSTVRPWGALSSHDLDFASADSAMGHTADLALGIALAQPARRVICLNGDGSMAMCLGTLLTAVQTAPANYALIVVENGTYEVTGNQPVPASQRVDMAGMARAAGFAVAHAVASAAQWEAVVGDVFSAAGPVFVSVAVQPGTARPIRRGDHEEARYLKVSLAEWARVTRAALTGGDQRAAED